MPPHSLSAKSLSLPAQKRRDAFFLCSRKAGQGMVAFSLLASCIGGTATLAMIALACEAGWPAFWWLGSGAIGLAILAAFFAKKIRATLAATLPEIIAQWQGKECRKLAAVIVLLSSIAIVAAQFNALGVILASLAHSSFAWGVIGGAFLVAIYTCAGGQSAVMKSDIWQFILLGTALFLCLCGLLANPECREALMQTPVRLVSKNLPLSRVIYFLVIFGSSFVIGPMIFGRLLSASSPRTAQAATFWAALGLALMALLITAIGIAISGLDLAAPAPEFLFSAACQKALPGWLNAFIIIGLLAAVVSSADSCLLGAAMVWSNDLDGAASDAAPVAHTRAAIIVITAISTAAVFCGKGILSLLLAASDIFTCGIVAPTIIMLVGCRKINPHFFLAAIILGGSCGVVSAITSNQAWSFTGAGISLSLALTGKLKPERN